MLLKYTSSIGRSISIALRIVKDDLSYIFQPPILVFEELFYKKVAQVLGVRAQWVDRKSVKGRQTNRLIMNFHPYICTNYKISITYHYIVILYRFIAYNTVLAASVCPCVRDKSLKRLLIEL